MAVIAESAFISAGERCAARVFLPEEAVGPLPCVLMAHGATATADLVLPAYAERFVGRRMVVVTFDYRHFGASAGEPRQLISIPSQLEDLRAALGFCRSLPQVDPARVALWGTSLGGGHVLVVAAEDPLVAAVVAQLPFVGNEWRRLRRPLAVLRGLRLVAAGLADLGASKLGTPERTLPLAGPPGSRALFCGETEWAFAQWASRTSPHWRNRLLARSILGMLGYRPMRWAPKVSAPLLVCAVDEEGTASLRLAGIAARRAPHGRLLVYPGEHFQSYSGPFFEMMVEDEAQFLEDALRPPGRRSAQSRKLLN